MALAALIVATLALLFATLAIASVLSWSRGPTTTRDTQASETPGVPQRPPHRMV